MSDDGTVIGLSGRTESHALYAAPIGWTAERRLIDFGEIYPAAINASGVIVGQRNARAIRVTIQ